MNKKLLMALLCAASFGICAAAQAQMHDDPGMHRDMPPPHRHAVAKCRDGHISYSHNRTCSHHGGVRRWYH